jgi:hypothetical protein
MAIQHLALFRWNPEVTPEQVDTFCAILQEFRAQMPVLVAYRYGPDLGLRAGNMDFGVAALVAQPAHISEYLDHPRHQAIAKDYISWMVAERFAVQFEVDID